MVTFCTPEAVKAWRSLDGWDRPHNHEASAYESALGVEDGELTVEEEAMDFIANIGLMQIAQREHETREQRNLANRRFRNWGQGLVR